MPHKAKPRYVALRRYETCYVARLRIEVSYEWGPIKVTAIYISWALRNTTTS